MEKRILIEGDAIEIEFEDGDMDRGTFLSFQFGDNKSDGYLIYEKPKVVVDNRLIEQIKIVPINLVIMVQRIPEE